MSLVLLMEGVNQLLIWRHFVTQSEAYIIGPLSRIGFMQNSFDNIRDDQRAKFFTVLNETAWNVFGTFWPNTTMNSLNSEQWAITQKALDVLDPVGPQTSSEKLGEAAATIFSRCIGTMLDAYGFEPPAKILEVDNKEAEGAQEQILAYYTVFELVFGALIPTPAPSNGLARYVDIC